MLTCDRCDSFITRELLFKLHIQEKHTDEFDSTNTDEEIYTNVETGEETAENSEDESTLRPAAESIIKEIASDDDESDNAVTPVGEILENKFHNHDDPIPILKISTSSIYQLMIRLVNPVQAGDALGVTKQLVENIEDDKDSDESCKYFEAIDADIAETDESKETVDELDATIQIDEPDDRDDDLETVDGDDHTPAATELHCHTVSEARESPEVNEPVDDAKERPAEPDDDQLQYLQYYAPPAHRGSKPGMLSSDLISVSPPESFIQNVQESNPEDCEVETWAGGRLKCLPDAQDIKKDSMIATYVSQAKDDEAKVVKNALNPGMHNTESVDMSQITHANPEVEIDEIDSEEENENLSERLKLLRS